MFKQPFYTNILTLLLIQLQPNFLQRDLIVRGTNKRQTIEQLKRKKDELIITKKS